MNPIFDKNLINTNYINDPRNFRNPLFPFVNPIPPYDNRNPKFYQNNNPIYLQRYNQLQNPFNFPYYKKPLPTHYSSFNQEDDFFLQNFYDTSRIQNYQPSYYSNPLNTPISAFDEKNILMRRLEQLNKTHSPGNSFK